MPCRIETAQLRGMGSKVSRRIESRGNLMTRALRIARIDDGEDVLQSIAERGLPTDRDRLLDVMDRHDWRLWSAADYLGVSRAKLQRMLRDAALEE